jgi:hypothetical protein
MQGLADNKGYPKRIECFNKHIKEPMLTSYSSRSMYLYIQNTEKVTAPAFLQSNSCAST